MAPDTSTSRGFCLTKHRTYIVVFLGSNKYKKKFLGKRQICKLTFLDNRSLAHSISIIIVYASTCKENLTHSLDGDVKIDKSLFSEELK